MTCPEVSHFIVRNKNMALRTVVRGIHDSLSWGTASRHRPEWTPVLAPVARRVRRLGNCRGGITSRRLLRSWEKIATECLKRDRNWGKC